MKIIGSTSNDGNTKLPVPLKYLINFRRSFEMPLMNGVLIITETWWLTWIIANSTGATTFTITDTKLSVLIVTLSTQDNAKLLQRLKYGKKTIKWNKYQSEVYLN